jgi:hypothetical protein
MSSTLLNPEQIEVVKTYFEALAFFRDEEYIAPDDGLLSGCTGTYAMIMADGGGDPVRLAGRMIFGEKATGLKLMP